MNKRLAALKKKLKEITFFLNAILFTTLSFASTIHVATTGSDDTGDGSEANPYATIQRGVDESNQGDTVLVFSGTYFE